MEITSQRSNFFFYLNVEFNSLQIHRENFSKISILFRINVKYSFFLFFMVCYWSSDSEKRNEFTHLKYQIINKCEHFINIFTE